MFNRIIILFINPFIQTFHQLTLSSSFPPLSFWRADGSGPLSHFRATCPMCSQSVWQQCCISSWPTARVHLRRTEGKAMATHIYSCPISGCRESVWFGALSDLPHLYRLYILAHTESAADGQCASWQGRDDQHSGCSSRGISSVHTTVRWCMDALRESVQRTEVWTLSH